MLRKVLVALVAVPLSIIANAALSQCSWQALTPTSLGVVAEGDRCSKCEFLLLPGRRVPTPHSRYTIHSDLPEILLTEGVLYTTRPVLPPFQTKDGTDVPEEMRTQINEGFKTVDGDFEVFLFHISQPGDGTVPRRLMVNVRNNGRETVVIRPRQVIVSDGIIGTVHEMESNLGRRVMEEDWDRPLESIEIPGESSAVVAWSKIFAAGSNGPDTSANVNCFGIVRATVESRGGAKADLTVSTLAVPGRDAGQNNMLAMLNSTRGAQSGEGYIDLLTPPQECQLRRTVGVFESFAWESDTATLDVAAIANDERLVFQIAAAQVQLTACPDAQQTAPMILRPPTVRPDTVGNYMIDYFVTLRLVNSDSAPRPVDVRFGKKDADIGLAWRVLAANSEPTREQLLAQPVKTGWAGPKQTADAPDDTLSFLPEGSFMLGSCEERFVALHFQILGNASLPFQLEVGP